MIPEEGSDRAEHAQSVGSKEIRIVEGVAQEDRGTPCPVCGRAVKAGQKCVTALGDARRGAIGVTVHGRCFIPIGQDGLWELMVDAYRRQQRGER